jgi:hypothetical protein
LLVCPFFGTLYLLVVYKVTHNHPKVPNVRQKFGIRSILPL